jgi:methanethiol S-methyltransferase
LYHLTGWRAWLLRLGQLLGVVYATYAAMQVGLARILGISGLAAWLKAQEVVPPTPEAQGPAPAPGESRLKISGPFRLQRHPLNFAPLPIFWLNPLMNVRLLAYNLVMAAYLVLGSLHEEYRLLKAYGQEYQAYQNSGVPFYLPRIH